MQNTHTAKGRGGRLAAARALALMQCWQPVKSAQPRQFTALGKAAGGSHPSPARWGPTCQIVAGSIGCRPNQYSLGLKATGKCCCLSARLLATLLGIQSLGIDRWVQDAAGAVTCYWDCEVDLRRAWDPIARVADTVSGIPSLLVRILVARRGLRSSFDDT